MSFFDDRQPGRPGLALVNRDAEQTHVSLGVRTPGRSWEHRWALSVLHTALGGGLSSRLFQEVRELRGLAYSVYSAVDVFADSGALSVYAACLPERFADVMRVTSEVLDAVARRLLGKRYGAAVLGPYASKRSLPQQLRAMVN